MFELGPDKLVIIVVAVLIFLGPKEIPAAVRTLRKWQRQVQSFRDTIKSEIGSVLELPRGGQSTPRQPPASGNPPAPQDRGEP
jgi:Sec-independent protein translocase protein TatA